MLPQRKQKTFFYNVTKNINEKQLTDNTPAIGDNERFSTVARNSSTLADIGALLLFNGFISTKIFGSCSSLSESLSESEKNTSETNKNKNIFDFVLDYRVKNLFSLVEFPINVLLVEYYSHLHQHLE